MSKQLFTKRFYQSGVGGLLEEKLAQFVNDNKLDRNDVQLVTKGTVKNGNPCLVLFYWADINFDQEGEA